MINVSLNGNNNKIEILTALKIFFSSEEIDIITWGKKTVFLYELKEKESICISE